MGFIPGTQKSQTTVKKLLRTTKEETLVKGYPSVKNIQEFHSVLPRGQPNKTLCKYSRWKGVKEARGGQVSQAVL